MRAILCLLLLIGVGGCRTEPPPSPTLKGTVTLDGIPLSEGFLTLHGDKGVTLTASITTLGRFDFEQVKPGKYTLTILPPVVINSPVPIKTAPDNPEIARSLVPPPPKVPDRYRDPKASELEIVLRPGQDEHWDVALNSNLTEPEKAAGTRRVGTKIGEIAPDIEGADLDGKMFRLSDYRGKVVVLMFWAHWCKLCRDRYADDIALAKRFEGQPFALLGVNTDRDRQAVKDLNAKLGTTWRSWWDGGHPGEVFANWRCQGMPSIFVIDQTGVIRAVNLAGNDLVKEVEILLLADEKNR